MAREWKFISVEFIEKIDDDKVTETTNKWIRDGYTLQQTQIVSGNDDGVLKYVVTLWFKNQNNKTTSSYPELS